MPRKRATILVYRSDRNLWTQDDGSLKCRVFDLFGASGPKLLLSRAIPPAVELDLDLRFNAGQAYGVSVDSPGHRPGWHMLSRRSFVRPDSGEREVDETIIRPMLVPNTATPSDLTAAFKLIEGQGSPFAVFGAQRFDALRQVAAKLAFLNLEAKLRETRIGTRSLLSLVRDVRAVAVDRVFLLMSAEAKRLIEDSTEFSDAPGHGAPEDPPGLPAHPDSWKHTKYAFGNLQLSFAKSATLQRVSATTTEACFSVDCDIDLERDLGHAFEFIHNQVFKKTTDQTLVYRMLWDQGVLPVFKLLPAAGATPPARIRVGAAPPAAATSRRRRAAGRPAAARRSARKAVNRARRKPVRRR
jgi:hypothetical protein